MEEAVVVKDDQRRRRRRRSPRPVQVAVRGRKVPLVCVCPPPHHHPTAAGRLTASSSLAHSQRFLDDIVARE